MSKHILIISWFLIISYHAIAQNGFTAKDSTIKVHNSLLGSGMIIKSAYYIDGVLETNQKGNAIQFDTKSSWKRNKGFIDGIVISRKKVPFLFPVGNKNVYRPVLLSNPLNATVRYSYEKPINNKQFNPNEIYKISDLEYWTLSGNQPSKITLTYNKESLVSEMTDEDLTKLTIVAWNGTNWTKIESQVDNLPIDLSNSQLNKSILHSTALQGSITTLQEIDLKKYTLFTFASYHTSISSELDLFTKIDQEMRPYNLLKRIHFGFNGKDLSEYSTGILRKLCVEIKNNPNSKIKLVGHADSYGSASYNYALGLKRAESIKNFFFNNGIQNIEVDIRSEGENDPKVVCQECPARFMVLNRRVDIYILNE